MSDCVNAPLKRHLQRHLEEVVLGPDPERRLLKDLLEIGTRSWKYNSGSMKKTIRMVFIQTRNNIARYKFLTPIPL
jgi:hypothetical protein